MKKIILFIVSFGTRVANAAFLICYQGSANNYVNVSLDNAAQLLNSSCIDYDLKTILFVTGYTATFTEVTATLVRNTYINENDYNVIQLDWDKEASDHGLSVFGYIVDLAIVPIIGNKLGDAITVLINGGINITSFQLMGMSLGAQLIGYAARRTKANNLELHWVTGLDPAGPAYEGIISLQHIDKNCGKFVDIVHADEGKFGTIDSVGHVDFWPNYFTRVTTFVQPGCPTGLTNIADYCSHERAWEYYMEAVIRPNSFPASWAKHYLSWAEANGQSDNVIYMAQIPAAGFKEGDYYLTTNSSSLYGKGKDGLKP